MSVIAILKVNNHKYDKLSHYTQRFMTVFPNGHGNWLVKSTNEEIDLSDDE